MSPDVATGALVDGRYKILSRLGAGGMADVFLAQDEQLGRQVALKLLHRRFVEDPAFVERFRREAQAAAGLQHPNVVSIYDRGSYDETYYIAMEYLPGRTLKQLIRDEAPLDPVRAIEISIQILKAARFAHRRGVIHRDLKPHNVMIDDTDHVKVTDFGIARAGASDMTETGSIMGTAQYLSPEQAQGHAVSAPSDLYSVAVVLYEMITGRVPFDAESAVTIALQHVSAAPTAPSVLNPGIPAELEQVVMWALNKNPADRPADADQFIAALEYAKHAIQDGARGQRTASIAAVAGLPVVGEQPGLAAPVPATTPAPGVVGLGAGVPVGPAGPAGGPPGDGSGTEPGGPQRRRRWWPWVVVALLALAAAGVAVYFVTRPTKDTVPTVVGEPLSTAQARVQNAGLTPNVIYRTDDAHPSGQVINQNPLGGQSVDNGATVTLTVSSGPGNGSVPSLQGLPLAQARALLRSSRLKPGRLVYLTSNQWPIGVVTGSDPQAGQTGAIGTSVTLFVSSRSAQAGGHDGHDDDPVARLRPRRPRRRPPRSPSRPSRARAPPRPRPRSSRPASM